MLRSDISIFHHETSISHLRQKVKKDSEPCGYANVPRTEAYGRHLRWLKRSFQKQIGYTYSATNQVKRFTHTHIHNGCTKTRTRSHLRTCRLRQHPRLHMPLCKWVSHAIYDSVKGGSMSTTALLPPLHFSFGPLWHFPRQFRDAHLTHPHKECVRESTAKQKYN